MLTKELMQESTTMSDQHQMRVKDYHIAKQQDQIHGLSQELKQTRDKLWKTNIALRRSERKRFQECKASQEVLQRNKQALEEEERLSQELKQTREKLAETTTALRLSESKRARECKALQEVLQQNKQALEEEERNEKSNFAQRQGNPRDGTEQEEYIRTQNELRMPRDQSRIGTSDMTDRSSQACTMIMDRSTSPVYQRGEQVQPRRGSIRSCTVLCDNDDPMEGNH